MEVKVDASNQFARAGGSCGLEMILIQLAGDEAIDIVPGPPVTGFGWTDLGERLNRPPVFVVFCEAVLIVVHRSEGLFRPGRSGGDPGFQRSYLRIGQSLPGRHFEIGIGSVNRLDQQ